MNSVEASNIVCKLEAVKGNSNINVANIVKALNGVEATTFATLTQASPVTLSAANKGKRIYKVTKQNVTLCNSDAGLYTNKVRREADADFTALPSHYAMVNDSYSVCSLISNPAKHYLRAIVNNCISSVYYDADADVIRSKEEVAKLCTPAAAKKMLDTSSETYVAHADVTHSVIIRTFALENIYSININKQSLTV
jgi:hypothetical protein